MNLYEKRFSIDDFIEECKKKDWIDIVLFAEKEYTTSCNILKNVDPYINDRRKNYNTFVHKFLFYIKSGIEPIGMNEMDIKNAKTVIDKLIEKGQWIKR